MNEQPRPFRVTLPEDARRPFQVVRYRSTPLTFDASKPSALAEIKPRARNIPAEVVREFLTKGGATDRMWIKSAVGGQLDEERVPAKLWEEMNLRSERVLPSRSKTLNLPPNRAMEFEALGFEVEDLEADDESEAATAADTAQTTTPEDENATD